MQQAHLATVTHDFLPHATRVGVCGGPPRIRRRLEEHSRSRTRSLSEELHPYTTRAEAEYEGRPDAGRYSTWNEEPQEAPPPPRVASQPRSHNYYPSMRSGVYRAQPVTLTASAVPFLPRTCCSMSRSQAMGGAGHHMAAGMGHR